MTDDELLALYLEASGPEERARVAEELGARGVDAELLDDLDDLDDFDDLGELGALASALDDPATWEEPSADLGDRIMADIAADLAPSSAPPTSAPPSAVVDLSPRREQRAGRPLRRMVPAVAAAAAAAAIGVGIGRMSRSSTPDFDAQVALAATPLAPGASAEVRVRAESAGVRIELEAVGLPEPPSGFIYEAWVTDGTIRIPIGTFSKGGSVVLWSGVSVTRFPTMTVTLEPIDADASSSGKVVLKGPISPG
jgi:hypothetical protein